MVKVGIKVKKFCYLIIIFLLSSCSYDDMGVRSYRVDKNLTSKKVNVVPDDSDLIWRKPKTWILKKSSQMRVASFSVPSMSGYEPADASIVKLSGEAGGLLANINRWRNQISLAPIDIAEIKKTAKSVTPNIEMSKWYPIINLKTNKAIYVAILKRDGETIFVKLVGDIKTLVANKGHFLSLVRSIDKKVK